MRLQFSQWRKRIIWLDLSYSIAPDFHHHGKGCMPFPTGERRVGALHMLELAPVLVTLYNAVRIRYQHTLEDADLTRFAEAVGLAMQQYARDMAEQRSLARIEEDREGGERSGVQGTPTFFINGVLYPGSWEQDALLAALQAASKGK